MSFSPCRERTFPLRLAHEFECLYQHYVRWLKQTLGLPYIREEKR